MQCSRELVIQNQIRAIIIIIFIRSHLTQTSIATTRYVSCWARERWGMDYRPQIKLIMLSTAGDRSCSHCAIVCDDMVHLEETLWRHPWEAGPWTTTAWSGKALSFVDVSDFHFDDNLCHSVCPSPSRMVDSTIDSKEESRFWSKNYREYQAS